MTSYPPPESNYAPAQPAFQQRTNVLAIVSLVSAFFISLVAIITGHIALSQIKRTGENGRGLALAGLILGYVGFIGGLLVFALLLGTLASVKSSGPGSPAQPPLSSTAPSQAPAQPTLPSEEPAPAHPSTPAEPSVPDVSAQPGDSLTLGEQNAIDKAQAYLDYTAFSRKGLIEQLEFEDFSKADATFAVDYISPNWNEQAAKKAQAYLDYSAFSRKDLIDQLEFDGFTSAQAKSGVAAVGY